MTGSILQQTNKFINLFEHFFFTLSHESSGFCFDQMQVKMIEATISVCYIFSLCVMQSHTIFTLSLQRKQFTGVFRMLSNSVEILIRLVLRWKIQSFKHMYIQFYCWIFVYLSNLTFQNNTYEFCFQRKSKTTCACKYYWCILDHYELPARGLCFQFIGSECKWY